MENKQTPAFVISLIVLFVLYLIILNQLPFPHDYGFGALAVVTVASVVIGLMIYGISLGIIQTIYTVLVEIAVAVLLFFNVTLLVVSWSAINEIKAYLAKLEILVEWNDNLLAILAVLLGLFIFNLLTIWVLYPLAQISGTTLLPDE